MADDRMSGNEMRQRAGWGIGIALGMGIGFAAGVALKNPALGIGLGVAVGLVFSVAFSARTARRDGDADPEWAEEVPDEQGDGPDQPDGDTPVDEGPGSVR